MPVHVFLSRGKVFRGLLRKFALPTGLLRNIKQDFWEDNSYPKPRLVFMHPN